MESDAAESSDHELPFQVSTRFWYTVPFQWYPTPTQELAEKHETPRRTLVCDAKVESDAAESSDHELPFHVSTWFWYTVPL
jgi:hypothetical protein